MKTRRSSKISTLSFLTSRHPGESSLCANLMSRKSLSGDWAHWNAGVTLSRSYMLSFDPPDSRELSTFSIFLLVSCKVFLIESDTAKPFTVLWRTRNSAASYQYLSNASCKHLSEIYDSVNSASLRSGRIEVSESPDRTSVQNLAWAAVTRIARRNESFKTSILRVNITDIYSSKSTQIFHLFRQTLNS